MNSSNLEISLIDEVLSKLIDHNLVSNKKTSAGIDSFRVLTEEPVDDQTYFNISDTDKNSSEPLTDDSQGIPDSSQINAVPPINTSFWSYQLNLSQKINMVVKVKKII